MAFCADGSKNRYEFPCAMQISRVPQYKQVWKAGFPPKVVFSPLTDLPNTAPITSVLSNRDAIILEAASKEELQQAIDRASAEDAAQPAVPPAQASEAASPRASAAAPAQRAAADSSIANPSASTAASPAAEGTSNAAAKCPAVLRTHGAAAGTYVQTHVSAAPPHAAQGTAQAPKRNKRRKADFPGLARVLNGADDAEREPPKDAVEAQERVETAATGALLKAARGGAEVAQLLGDDWTPSNAGLFKALRGDLRSARAQRDSEAAASVQISAARAGKVTLHECHC